MATIEKRQNAKQKVTYHVKVRLRGFPQQFGTFTRITDAKRWAQQVEASMRQGKFFKNSESNKHTLGKAIDRYITYELPKKLGYKDDQKTHYAWWKKELGVYT